MFFYRSTAFFVFQMKIFQPFVTFAKYVLTILQIFLTLPYCLVLLSYNNVTTGFSFFVKKGFIVFKNSLS